MPCLPTQLEVAQGQLQQEGPCRSQQPGTMDPEGVATAEEAW